MKALFIAFSALVFSQSVYASSCDTTCQLNKLSLQQDQIQKKLNSLDCESISNDYQQTRCWDYTNKLIVKLVNTDNEILPLAIKKMSIATNELTNVLLEAQKEAIKKYWQTHLYTCHVH